MLGAEGITNATNMPFERKSALKNIILIPYVERKEEQLTK
jgi:hypothetical protein